MRPTRRRRSRSTAPRTILILAYTTRFLPIAYTSSAAGMRSINPEMEEAVRILGGGRLTAIRRVLAPLLKRNLAGAWILVFIPATRELSLRDLPGRPEHAGHLGDAVRPVARKAISRCCPRSA